MRATEISTYGNLALTSANPETVYFPINLHKRANFIKNAIAPISSLSLYETFQKPLPKVDLDSQVGSESGLKDSGFDLQLELQRFYQNYNTALKQTINKSASLISSYYELDANLRTFAREFIQGGLVLPMLIEQHGNHIVNSYDKQRVVDKITDQERAGSVKLASEKVETIFAENEGEIMTVINSPIGWTGFKDKDGKDFEYRDTQSLIKWRGSDGKLRGFTVVSDLSLQQGKEFLGMLGVDQQKLQGKDEKDEIVKMVSNPAEIKGSERFKKPEDIVEALISVRGEGNMRFHLLDGTVVTKTTQELRDEIKRRDTLLNFDQQTETFLGELKEFIFTNSDNLSDPDFQKKFAINIELVVLGITRELTKPKKTVNDKKVVPEAPLVTLESLRKNDFSEEKAYLQNQVGCSKGVSSGTKSFSSSFGQTISALGSSFSGGGVSSSESSEKMCKDCGERPQMKGGCGWCEPCGNKH